MRIRTFSDPVLRRVAAPVKRIDETTRRLAARMVRAMRDHKGVGLAAPQVGVSSRLIVVDVGDGLHVLVNPRITASRGSAVDWEGCLSFPGLLAEVERAEKVSVEALGLDGKPVWVEAEGFAARAFQHEIDHLDGVVILDRARTVERVEPEETTQVELVDEAGPAQADAAGPGTGTRTPGPEAPRGAAGQDDGPQAARPLKVAFMGTPSFAVPVLEAIIAAGHTVVGVVTQPDRPAGRGGRTIRPSPVKKTALAFGLPVWQGTAQEAKTSLAGVLAGWGAEVAVVVAYGVILPPDVLKGPRLGCVNLHASLLPDYRGAAPIQRAIMDGRSVTGVTVIRMDEGVDTGDIIAQREVPIRETDTAGDVHDRLAAVGANLVLHALDLLATGRAAPRPQPAGPATPAPRLGPEDEVIDWTRPAVVISRQIRALAPAPGAYTFFRGRRVKVWRADPVWSDRAALGEHHGAVGDCRGATAGDGETSGQNRAGPRAGEVVALDEKGPVVATGKGALLLRVLQPAGGSRMTGTDFANGQRLGVGDRFESPEDPTDAG